MGLALFTPTLLGAELLPESDGPIAADGSMYVGVDYYPEHWPEERWETDFRLMQEAGFNIVRLAEFAWVNLEPSEGQFEFGWLDRVLDLADAHDIKVILGTPTAVMPAWLARKYPAALSMKPDGTRTVWGGRRNNCFSDKDYRRLSKQIVKHIAEHYRDHPTVVGWQIDNELGGTDCRCEACRNRFQKWLANKYGDLDTLNDAWGNRFWGLKFSDWAEIPIPDDREGDWAISNPSASLDWKRFASYQNESFLNAQVTILRAVCPRRQFITHNFMGLFDKLNYYDLARQLDFVSWDNYPSLSPDIPYDAALAADVMRSLKKQNFLIMEQTAGPLGWGVFSRNPRPGELRSICYQQLAHGADGQIWFRWRTCTAGREQYWHGLLGHDGKPGRRYREAAQVCHEYKTLAPELVGTTVHPETAIVYDYDSIWALQIQNGYPGASQKAAIQRYYRALMRCGISVDIVQPGDVLSQYKLVLAPHLNILTDDYARQLTEYVRNGGVILADCRTGVKNATNLVHDRTLPGLLSDPLGILIEEYESTGLGIADDAAVAYHVRFGGSDIAPSGDELFTTDKYADWITRSTALQVAGYEDWHLKPYAAVTRNTFEKGIGWYVGTVIKQDRFYDELIRCIAHDAKVEPAIDPSEGVEVVVRSRGEHRILFLINHTDGFRSVKVPEGKRELLSGEKTSEILILDSFAVALVEL